MVSLRVNSVEKEVFLNDNTTMHYEQKKTDMLKNCSKLFSHSIVLKVNNYLIILVSAYDYINGYIIVRIKLNFSYVTVFHKNGRMTGQFSADLRQWYDIWNYKINNKVNKLMQYKIIIHSTHLTTLIKM